MHDYHPWARGSLAALQQIKIQERQFIVFCIASLINKKNHVAYSLRATTAHAKTQTKDVFILNILKSGVSRIDRTFFISFRNPLMQRKKFLQFLGCKGVVVLDFQTNFCANRITYMLLNRKAHHGISRYNDKVQHTVPLYCIVMKRLR